MTYFGQLCRAMELIAEHPRSIFLGQAVAEKGTGMTASFAGVPREKLLELPVFEDCQLGDVDRAGARRDAAGCRFSHVGISFCWPHRNW